MAAMLELFPYGPRVAHQQELPPPEVKTAAMLGLFPRAPIIRSSTPEVKRAGVGTSTGVRNPLTAYPQHPPCVPLAPLSPRAPGTPIIRSST
jgi:hypothetical protein